jgi:hypothetical protein
MRRSGAITTARRVDVLEQMICAHLLTRFAWSESARDRQICALLTAVPDRILFWDVLYAGAEGRSDGRALVGLCEAMERGLSVLSR